MDASAKPVDVPAGGRRRLLAAVALVASPIVLLPTAFGLLLLPGVAALLGPRAWRGWTAGRAAVLGAFTLGAMIAGFVAAFPVVGLCGPEGSWTGGAILTGFTLYVAVSAVAVGRPRAWPLAPLAGAAGVDAVGAVAHAAGVAWVC